jgi:hypothetical protein
MVQADRISVSLTRRLKSGFSTGLEASIRRNETGLLALGNAFQVAGAGMRKIENESVMTLRFFQRLLRASFVLQTALGALAGSIGDLAGGVLSLVGILGQASYAFVGVGGAMASVIAGFAVAKIAMSGVGRAVSQLWNGQNQYNRSLRETRKELKDLKFDLESAVLSEKEAAIELEKARTQLAMVQDLPPDNMVRRESELAFQRADLNYRRAKSRVNDLQDTIKRGGNRAGASAAADPFRNLTKSQIAFAKYLATLKPIMQALKEASASSFLPPLQTAIETIVNKAFPTLQAGFKVVGSAMGDASESFATAFSRNDNLELLKQFFDDSAPRIRDMGIAAGKFFGGLLGTLAAAKPLTDQFTTWISSIAARFELLSKSKSFKRTLDLAAYVSTQLGHVFGGFADGIKNIMDANFPPGGGGAGQVLLDWLNGIASGFKKFTGSDTFAKWLKDSTTNATVMLGVIGDFLNIFIDLAAQPEIKAFWTTLQGAIPSITKMLMDGLKAGPSFAELIVSVTKLMTIFSDAEGLIIFFDVIKNIVDFFVKILTPFKEFIDFIGRITSAVLAVTAVTSLLTLGGVIFLAFIGQVVKNLGLLVKMIIGTTNWMARFNTELAVSKPGIVAWGKALFTSMYQGIAASEKGSKAIATLKASYAQLRQSILNYITATQWLNESVGRVSTTLGTFIQKLKSLKDSAMSTALSIRISLTAAMQKFKDVAGTALGNAKFALYTTLIQKGRLVSDFYNTRVMPVMTKFRDLIVNKFNDARLAIYGTLQQKGRMIADLYNTRVVPALQKFLTAISPDAIRVKMRNLAIAMLMGLDLLDNRIIPGFRRIRDGIKNILTQITTALSPENISARMIVLANSIKTGVSRIITALSPNNIRLKTLGFRMGLMMSLDLLDSRITPALMRASSAIKNGITQIGIALSPENISARVIALTNSITSGIAKIGAAMSPQNIRLKTLGFRIGMMMHIDLIDKRIVPAFMRMNAAIINFGKRIGSLRGVIRLAATDIAAWGSVLSRELIGKIRLAATDIAAWGSVLKGELINRLKTLRTAVMQSTAMIKLHTAATRLAAAASKMWNGLTSKLSDIFRSTKDSLGGFIDRMKAKTSTVQASTAADVAATAAIKNKTKALTEEQKAAAAAAGARRPGAGMALMGAGFAAQGLISGAANGGMTAGSALTTIGGAAMFIPGGMIPGLVAGIVGAILQGFESAAAAEKQRTMEIAIENAEIIANQVNVAETQFSKEQSLLLMGTDMDLPAVTAEIQKRERVATEATQSVLTEVGITEKAISDPIFAAMKEIRLAFVESGVKIKDTEMPALLRAAATNLAYTPGAVPADVSASVLSEFQSGGLKALLDTFKIDPTKVVEQRVLKPGEAPKTVVTTRGVDDLQTQLKGIDAYVKSSSNQIVTFGRRIGSTQAVPMGKPKLDTSGLEKFGIDAVKEYFLANKDSLDKIFDSSVQTALANAAEGKFTPARAPGSVKDEGWGFDFGFAFPRQSVKGADLSNTITINPSSKQVQTPLTLPGISSLYSPIGSMASKPGASIFSTKDINALRGTTDKPLITSIKPADIASLKADPKVGSRTVTALEKLSGVVDSAGGYLQIKDVSATDQVAPFIVYPKNASTSDKALIDDINNQFKQSWRTG